MTVNVKYCETTANRDELFHAMEKVGYLHYFSVTSYWLAGLVVDVWMHVRAGKFAATYYETIACHTDLHGVWLTEEKAEQQEIHRRLDIGPIPEYLDVENPRNVTGEKLYQHSRGG
jgi:hypothetical protein